MKKKDKEALAKLTLKELYRKLEEEVKALAKLRIDKNLGRIKNQRALSKKRDEIAVIKTKIREKELYG